MSEVIYVAGLAAMLGKTESSISSLLKFAYGLSDFAV